ncbi:hypothetical protein [Cupriavidus necator]|uniref:hypothetical protein n=1 Tax=Cupriavidus necator TaxID=106590 RepID=UPI000A9F3BE2|nr:hypothetical protein [Cupriavidus necator]
MPPYQSGWAIYFLLYLTLTPDLWVPWLLRAESIKGLIAFGVLAMCMPAAFALIIRVGQ